MSVIVATTVEAPITPVEDACYICLETGDAGDRALAANVCACLTSRVHVRCVEIMVNSTARRAKPLAERTACAVCTRPYTIDFAPYLIDVTGQHPCRRWVRSSSGRLILQCAAVLAAMGAIATAGIWIPPRIAVLVAIGTGAVIGILVFVYKARRYAQKTNDDNVFHERAVAKARRSVRRGYRCTIEEAESADPKRVILVAQGRLSAYTACSTTQNSPVPKAVAASVSDVPPLVTAETSAGTSAGTSDTEATTAFLMAVANASPACRLPRRSTCPSLDDAGEPHVVVEIVLHDEAAGRAREHCPRAEDDEESVGASWREL
mmetsp:Transcript_20866/g.49435  ORF Transcript_20866/g.49435 Transcript_20866/m.49435 type:complete len:320 (+) Transcript_20866:54-1013(+)